MEPVNGGKVMGLGSGRGGGAACRGSGVTGLAGTIVGEEDSRVLFWRAISSSTALGRTRPGITTVADYMMPCPSSL